MQNIPEKWRENAFTILEASRLVNQQHEALSFPEFKKWLAGQPVGTVSTAQKLATIARHPILGDAAYTAKLPPNWGKLYEASFLPEVFLRDKINNGGLERISRHEIYRIRNRPTRIINGRQSSGMRVRVPPEYKRISEWARRGLVLEEKDKLFPTEAAAAIGMKKDTYNRARVIVMLYDRNDLNAEDRKMVAAALAEMDEKRKVSAPFRYVRPVLEKIFGVNRRGVHLQDEKKRKENFGKAISVICDTCFAAVDVKIPFMGRDEINSAVNKLLDASESLSKLIHNIRRSGND